MLEDKLKRARLAVARQRALEFLGRDYVLHPSQEVMRLPDSPSALRAKHVRARALRSVQELSARRMQDAGRCRAVPHVGPAYKINLG